LRTLRAALQARGQQTAGKQDYILFFRMGLRCDMKAAAIFFAAFLLFCSTAFSSVQWSYNALSPLNPSIALLPGLAALASADGTVYALSLSDGGVAWSYDLGSPLSISPCALNGSTLAVAADSGKLSFISARGKETGKALLPGKPVALSCGAKRAYVALENSVIAYNPNGAQAWNVSVAGMPGAIGQSARSVYFTSAGKLYSLSAANGAFLWAAQCEDSFLSRPSEYGNEVYVGASDGKLRSFDRESGRQRFEFPTDGWVVSTPVKSGDAVYFGSADGNFYSVSSNNGREIFRFRAGEGIWSSPYVYESSGRKLVLFGTTEGGLFALDAQSGQEAWSFSTSGRIGDIASSDGNALFATTAGKAYSISPSPTCSFTYPKPNGVVGNFEQDLEGRAYSDSQIIGVEVRIAGGQWLPAQGAENWRASVDFSGAQEGAVAVECRVRDTAGRQDEEGYSSLSLIKMAEAPPQKMYVSAPGQVGPNQTFSISATDSTGRQLYGLQVAYLGKNASAQSPFNASFGGRAGAVGISIEKNGFEPAYLTIVSSESGGALGALIPAIAILAIVAAAFVLMGRLRKK
jgi:outer membrane protein assembly factor BamB